MTSHTMIFQSDKDDKWYYWREAWRSTAGPFDEFNEAHQAFSEYLKELRGDKETSSEESVQS